MDLNNYNNPIQRNEYKDNYFLIDRFIFKQMLTMLKTIEIHTDSGWYTDSISITKDFMMDSKEIDFQTRSANMPLCEIDIQASHNRDISQRRYAKIDVIFGNISGTIGFLIILFSFITKLRNDMYLVIETMNLLYSFPQKIEKIEKIQKTEELISANKTEKTEILQTSPDKIEKIPTGSNLKINISRLKYRLSSVVGKKFSQSIEKKQELEKYWFSFNFLQYLKSLLKWKFGIKLNSKEHLIVETKHQYEKEMDCANILIKLQEIDYLKKILLNEKQYILFQYLSKPMITNKAVKSSTNSTTSSEASSLLQDLKEDAQNNSVNANLIKLIDQNLMDFQTSAGCRRESLKI